MSVRHQRIRDGLVATILKGTLLAQPGGTRCGFEHFLAGTQADLLFGTPVIKWWKTLRREKALRALSGLVFSVDHYKSIDLNWGARAGSQLLKEICIDQNIFSWSKLSSGEATSLFDCLRISLSRFGGYFVERLRAVGEQQVRCRLTAWPLAQNISGPSFFVEALGAGLIDSQDGEAWERRFIGTFHKAQWDVEQQDFPHAKNLLGDAKFRYLAVSVDNGTDEWCSAQAESKLRTLLGVVLAQIAREGSYFALDKVMAAPPECWVQFPEAREPQLGWRASSSPPLIPNLAAKPIMSSGTIGAVEDWFRARQMLAPAVAGRADKGAYFLNLAANESGMNAFLFHYIALDSLFGTQWNVETGIQRGLTRTAAEHVLKAPWLYQLRNEIVHGGSRTLREWKDYQRYIDHFNSLPERDIELIALQSLSRFPELHP